MHHAVDHFSTLQLRLSKTPLVNIKIESLILVMIIFSSWKLDYRDVTAQKIKLSIKNFFSKCDKIRSFLPFWSFASTEEIFYGKLYFFVQCVYRTLSIAMMNVFSRQLFLRKSSIIGVWENPSYTSEKGFKFESLH